MAAKRPRPEAEQRFYAAWKRCARLSQCDAWGGAECRRVYREWIAAGRPALVVSFIRRRANVGSEG